MYCVRPCFISYGSSVCLSLFSYFFISLVICVCRSFFRLVIYVLCYVFMFYDLCMAFFICLVISFYGVFLHLVR